MKFKRGEVARLNYESESNKSRLIIIRSIHPHPFLSGYNYKNMEIPNKRCWDEIKSIKKVVRPVLQFLCDIYLKEIFNE